jgi:hypothetical protein
MRGVRLALVWAALVVLGAGPGPAAAQVLDRVETLIADGDVVQAREQLLAWWDGPRAGAAREEVQRGLWLRGLLNLDPSQATLDYTRLTVEYPGGPFTDRALHRLAGVARARGDLAEARRHYAVLARDYPSSPLRLEARAWLDAHPADGGGSFAVQAGAFSDRSRADDLAARLREAGFEPRLVVVEGSDLVRVRLGRFMDAAGATRVHDALVGAGFEAMVVGDAGREVGVSGSR